MSNDETPPEVTYTVPSGTPVSFQPDPDEEIQTVAPIKNDPPAPVSEPVVTPQKPVVPPEKEEPKVKDEVKLETPPPVQEPTAPEADLSTPEEPTLQDVLDSSKEDAGSSTDEMDLGPSTEEDVMSPEESVEYPKDEKEDPLFDVPIGNLVEDLSRLTLKYNPTLRASVIADRLKKNPNDFYVKLIRLFDQLGIATDLYRDNLTRLKQKGVELKHNNPDNISDELIRGTEKSSGELSGADAKIAVLARAKGLRKVHLFNSGFWVLIRPPELAELSQWFNQISTEAKDFGKIVGGHFFMFSDVFLKQKFMEILPYLIVDSNLKGFRSMNLSKMISIQDYDVLVWAVCTLVYKTGVTINLQCTNEKCAYEAANVTLDLEKMRFNNLSIVPQEAVGYLSKLLAGKEQVNTTMLKQYHKLLKLSQTFVLDDVSYKVRVPSIDTFVSTGTKFIEMVLGAIKGTDNQIDRSLDEEVRLNLAKAYAPWVYRIETPQFSTSDTDAIIAQMEIDVRKDNRLSTFISSYQFDTRISYFCYSMLECPKCHKTPSKDLHDYYPLDPTSLFFFLCSRQLSLMTA